MESEDLNNVANSLANEQLGVLAIVFVCFPWTENVEMEPFCSWSPY